jgi:type VI secretion system protein ImpM
MPDGALSMALSVYGKHPAKGDFVEYGLADGLKPVVEGWLDAVLAETRHALGDAWDRAWPVAPALRFWLGEAIWGEPVCGVLMTSADRVGRRFPLVIFASGAEAAALPAPAIAPDQAWYDGIEAHLRAVLRMADFATPAALLAGVTAPLANRDTPTAGPVDFWAVRPGSGVAGLLADIALTDHRRAAMGRSYWWVAGQEPLPESGAVPEPVAVPAPVADPEPEAVAVVKAPVASAWDLPEDDDSPFAAPSGPSLFAAPEAADPEAAVAVAPDVVLPPAAPRVLWSQVWAGEGLPSGHVLAWFLRGYDGNG